tara:strand:+ start:64 stop:528 length:465 start_codon:yes stop_codon:yes gene_type:complete
MISSNKLLQIYKEIITEQGKNFQLCYCGICHHYIDKKINQKFLITQEQVKPFFLYQLEKQKKVELIEAVCIELKEIRLNDLMFGNAYSDTFKKEDVFFNQKGSFVRHIIMYIDTLLRNRKLLHSLLGRSLVHSYLIRMENHSGDFGNIRNRILN